MKQWNVLQRGTYLFKTDEVFDCHCVVRPIWGMPALVTTALCRQRPEATKQLLTGDWLPASKPLMALNLHFIQIAEENRFMQGENTEKW